jgi:hypothetical protein
MPGFVITFANTVLCTHGGYATPIPPVGRVLIMGLGAVLTNVHTYAIVSCGFPAATLGVQPPCVTGRFFGGTIRVRSMGSPLAVLPLSVASSKGLPNPTPLIVAPSGQARVIAT